VGTTIQQGCKGLSTPGNKVAENGNNLLSETATLLPKTATNCYQKRQQSCRFRQLVWTGLKTLLGGVLQTISACSRFGVTPEYNRCIATVA